MTRNAFRRLAAAFASGAAVLLCQSAAATADEVDRLIRAYPDLLDRREGNELVWKDGTRMSIDDGVANKSEDALLAKPDIEDMFRYAYPAAFPKSPPADDPGRIRYEPFFKKLYGDCKAGGVSRDLVGVDWLPRHKGGRVQVTRINGVDRRLKEVSEELDRLPEPLIRHLVPSAGTFVCRPIAGTTQLSAHGYGIAIDVNTASSDYWRWSKSGYRNRIPLEIVEIFERHGFIWGGKWRHFDTMHFEYRPELLGAVAGR